MVEWLSWSKRWTANPHIRVRILVQSQKKTNIMKIIDTTTEDNFMKKCLLQRIEELNPIFDISNFILHDTIRKVY